MNSVDQSQLDGPNPKMPNKNFLEQIIRLEDENKSQYNVKPKFWTIKFYVKLKRQHVSWIRRLHSTENVLEICDLYCIVHEGPCRLYSLTSLRPIDLL